MINNIPSEVIDAAYEWCQSLGRCAEVSEEEITDFWNRLIKSPAIFEEYLYYMCNQNFICRYRIGGMSIVDILVWQIDYFKAGLDMGRAERDNPDRMLYTAFRTMLDMEADPDRFKANFEADSGTDYPGKY